MHLGLRTLTIGGLAAAALAVSIAGADAKIYKLTAGSNGSLDPADYERTVNILLSGGSDPVITKAPEGAWTHAVSDKAGLQ